MNEFCKWCGRNQVEEGEHHLFRRSTSPELIDDPKNKVELCVSCHRYATESKEVEQLFQEYFFLKPEVEKLTVDYVAEFMKSQSVISPRDIMRFRNFLAAEYFFLDNRYIELERQRPFAIEKFRAEVKSDTRAQNQYEMTAEGMVHKELKTRLKSIEKMLSALRTSHEQMQKEGQMIF